MEIKVAVGYGLRELFSAALIQRNSNGLILSAIA
jgi:hypothetical protein